MKKKLRIALYNPYLDTLGGGEKHILSIIKALSSDHSEPTIFWNENLTLPIYKRFNLQLPKTTSWISTNKLLGSSLKTMNTLRNYDYFFYVTDGSYFFSSAKKNYVYCMVPDPKLYRLNLVNRCKLLNYKFISISDYVSEHLKKYGIDPITITPYIEEDFFIKNPIKKEKIILSVGRFFPQLHSKNQKKIIDTYMMLKRADRSFNDYKLILAGGLKKEDRRYLAELRSLAKKDSSIIFKPNINSDEIKTLYRKADYFWHLTGLGNDERKHPELVEHFGISPLEAMASGCIVLCHNSGGPKKIIDNRKTGFLFDNENELVKTMINIENDNLLKSKIRRNGEDFVKKSYNYHIFENKVLKYL